MPPSRLYLGEIIEAPPSGLVSLCRKAILRRYRPPAGLDGRGFFRGCCLWEALLTLEGCLAGRVGCAGLSESSIVIVIGIANRVYRYAARHLDWSGANPVSLLLPSERPKPSQRRRRRIFEGRELEQTIAAAAEPVRTLFILAALTGARLSELLALTWADVRLHDLDDAEIEFGWQVDR